MGLGAAVRRCRWSKPSRAIAFAAVPSGFRVCELRTRLDRHSGQKPKRSQFLRCDLRFLSIDRPTLKLMGSRFDRRSEKRHSLVVRTRPSCHELKAKSFVALYFSMRPFQENSLLRAFSKYLSLMFSSIRVSRSEN